MTTRKRDQERKVGAWTKFRLLMWKNFLQQGRHRVQTTVEFLLPVLTMTLVLLLRWQIEPERMDIATYPSFSGHTLNFSSTVLGGMNLTQISFAYSPKNDLLEEVVQNAVTKLILNNFRAFVAAILEFLPIFAPDIEIQPDISLNITLVHELIRRFVERRVDGYNSSKDLRGIYAEEATTRVVVAAIEFEDELYNTTALPKNMKYSLRFPERPRLNSFFSLGGLSWRTDAVFPAFELPGPRFPYSWEGGNDPGYVNEMFIALQHVISTEIIATMTNEDVHDYDVSIQRYPHPPYIRDLAVEALQFLFPMFIMLSYSYTAVNIVRAVTVEKELQLKETMKIMGLPTWLHWTAWFCKQFIYLLFSTILIVVILKVNWFTSEEGFSDYAVFTNTPGTVLFFYITLYLTCTIFFCFMLSGFFSKGSTAALFAGVVWFLTYIPAFLLGMDVSMSVAVQAITCLSINSAMSYGFQLLLARETTGGMQWGEFMFSPATDSSRFVFGHVVLMLALDCVIFMLIALYLEQVMPGPYGTPKPWYFILQKHYWCARQTEISNESTENNNKEQLTMEKDPIGHEVGVKISNLSKMYGIHAAVNNLSLNIYDDQITVLLGHNGAGKSTTISMLTGNLAPSRGSIWVAGYDMRTQSRHARAHIGLCPQHNVLFNELTVKEHLEFFARLKGFYGREMEDEVDSLIGKLELQEKRDYQAHGLSGGQKRRLAVGIALCGAARVVLLDEPTSGMDPASRRALWDLLQKEKKGRSMILTTHFMDEADILGDRVAIMAQGRLQCVGSPYFLKRHYGIGYTLVVVKGEGFDYFACTDLINKYIPGTLIKEDRGMEISYSLTNDCSNLFHEMLNDLEENMYNIKFKNYGLVATTMEDVFMSVGSDVATVSSLDSDDGATVTESYDEELESSLEQLNNDTSNESVNILWRHVLAIWLKLWLVWTRSWQLLVIQVSVPILIIVSTLGVMEYVMSLTGTIQARELSLTQGFTSTETLLHYAGTDPTNLTSLGVAATTAYQQLFTREDIPSMTLTPIEGQTIDDYYLERTNDSTTMGMLRNTLLIGATFTDDSATAWFSNFGYHDVANSLAAVHSALLRARVPDANLTVYNHPLEVSYNDQSDMQVILSLLSMQFSSGIGSSMGIVSAVFIMFYIKERVSRAKLLQKAAGISPITMWVSAAVFDWTWHLILCIPILISCVAFQVIGFSTATELGRMYVCLMVYGLAMLPMDYVFSYFFKGPAVGFVTIFFANVLIGMMGSQIVEALWAPQLDTEAAADIMDMILQFFPLYSLVTAVRSLHSVGLVEWSCLQGCEHLSSVLPNLNECTMEAMCEFFSEQCCVRDNPYWEWEKPGVLRYIVCMLATCLLMWIVLMTAEYRLLQKVFNRERRPPPVDESTLDADVADEGRHVEKVEKLALGEHGLVAKRISKYYGKHLAVDQVSFTVSDGECFGLLGVNGAGKTTTFKMLMGDETISSGDAFVSGHSVKTDITKVHERIGYCPQFDAVFDQLTGRETLRFFSMLRGLKSENVPRQIETLAQALGFFKHLDKRVYQYSGGNKRKLSTAVALLGRTRLVFVDEPTTGVDPAAKRQVWRAVQGARRVGRGVVLTSHSMEECEALCSRLTIMVNGRFQCLGTPQHLKNKFSEGFTLTIKMRMDDDAATSNEVTDAIKNYVKTNFTNPKIMEEYQGLLTYYLPDRTMAWSKMFGVMETAKRDLDVEDYTISQTTLEQIFLQFTKYQQENISEGEGAAGAINNIRAKMIHLSI